MRFPSSIVFLALIILSGCVNTEGTLDISGKVLDEITKKGIPNRKVIIQGQVCSGAGITFTSAGQFITDSSGCFACTLSKTKGVYWYSFNFVGDSLYSTSTKEIIIIELQENSKYLTFYLEKLTDLAIKINRCSKIPLADTLYVSWKSNDIEGETLYPSRVINYGNTPIFRYKWVGGNIKSIINAKVLANKNTVICWEIFRNGKKKEITDTIYCESEANNCYSFKY